MKKTMGWLKRPGSGVTWAVIALFLAPVFVGLNVFSPRELMAQINTPVTQVGRDAGQLSPLEAPCIPFTVGVGTGTTEVLIVSNSTSVVTTFATRSSTGTSPGYLSWVMLSTGNTGSYAVIRDTGVVGTTDGLNNLVGNLIFVSTAAGAPLNGIQSEQLLVFIPPARFSRGLTMQVVNNGGNPMITACVRTYNQSYP